MERHKKFTLASKLALVGGLLILLNPYPGMFLWVGRPGTGSGLLTLFPFVAIFWFVCGTVVMVCAYLLKFKSRHKVAFGATIILCSILSAFYFLFLFLPFPHLSALPWLGLLLYGLYNPVLSLGIVLGVIGGLCAILAEKNKTETKELTREEHDKLTEEEKRMKEEYEWLMGRN